MNIKQPKTYEEQISILRNRGCAIDDDFTAIEFLKRVNYYRFSGYLIPFKQADGVYIDGTNFKCISSIYTFDQDLRGILIKALSEIEITARSVIAYRHGHRYGALGYLEAGNFNEKHDHEKFIRQFEVSIQNNRNSLFVKHHMEVYESHFPIWVATELFTMGMVSLFFADLLSDDKKAIAKEYNTDYVHLESWLHSSSVLRNICAHYGRLYNIRFHQSPRLPRKQAKRVNRNESSLFNQVYMLKFLYKNYRDEWNNAILSLLSALIEKHDKFLDLKTMGFPPNWEETLSW